MTRSPSTQNTRYNLNTESELSLGLRLTESAISFVLLINQQASSIRFSSADNSVLPRESETAEKTSLKKTDKVKQLASQNPKKSDSVQLSSLRLPGQIVFKLFKTEG